MRATIDIGQGPACHSPHTVSRVRIRTLHQGGRGGNPIQQVNIGYYSFDKKSSVLPAYIWQAKQVL